MTDSVAVTEIDETDEIDAGGKLEVLDPTGHFEISWGRRKSEVEAAEAAFNDLIKKGFLAFKKTWVGRKGKRAAQFDPKAGVYIFDSQAAEVKPDEAKKVDETDKDGEFSHEQTKKFDKNAEHTLVPPLRGG